VHLLLIDNEPHAFPTVRERDTDTYMPLPIYLRFLFPAKTVDNKHEIIIVVIIIIIIHTKIKNNVFSRILQIVCALSCSLT